MALFRTGAIVSTGMQPSGLTMADMNGDGHLDLVTANNSGNDVTVLIGNGLGDFAWSTATSTGVALNTVGAGDLDGDGDLDLVAAGDLGGIFFLWNDDGKAKFTVSSSPVTTSAMLNIEIGDLNGDGKLDFVWANHADATISVMLNKGSGKFTEATLSPFTSANLSHGLVMADLDGDLDLDLAATDSTNNNVKILLNDGTGKFGAPVATPVGLTPYGLASGDLNGDGYGDMVSANWGGNTMSVLLNDKAGGFTAGTTVSGLALAQLVELGDLDGDSDLDAVVVDEGNAISFLLNDGMGTFTVAGSVSTTAPATTTVTDVELADVDEDGDLDVLTSNLNGYNVEILINTGSNYAVSSAVSAVEGASGAGGELVFTISRTATSEAENITYTLGGTASGADYTAPAGTVSFIAGQKTAQVRISITGDSEIEGSETVVLTLGTASGEGKISTTAGSGTATIINDDAAPNNAPVLGTANADATLQSGMALNLLIGDGHFTDPDGNDLDYAITVNGGAKPAWLTFDAETGLLTGVPTTAEAGTYLISVKASDGAASSPADEFSLIVSNPIAPQDPQGTRRNDRLFGDGRDNIMDGKKGDDKLTGGDGADTFVFGKGYGRDVIRDFDATEGDRIDLSDAVGIRNFNDLIAHHVNDDGPHLKITADDGSVLVIKNFDDAGELAEDMFIL